MKLTNLGFQEEQNRGKPNWEHLNDELHVLITVEDSENRAKLKLERAVEEVKKLLTVVSSLDTVLIQSLGWKERSSLMANNRESCKLSVLEAENNQMLAASHSFFLPMEKMDVRLAKTSSNKKDSTD